MMKMRDRNRGDQNCHINRAGDHAAELGEENGGYEQVLALAEFTFIKTARIRYGDNGRNRE